VGRRLSAALARDGVRVRALSRTPARVPPELATLAEPVGWDGVRVPPATLAGAESVVHLAGEPIFGRPFAPASHWTRVRESRVASTASLVAALRELPPADRPAALVCASAVGIYADGGDAELDEGAPLASGFLGELCRDWEREASRAGDVGVRVVSLRIGIALAREGGALAQLVRLFRLGLGGPVADGRQWLPWIHVDDLVALARACLRDARFTGPVNATSPSPVRNAELTRALAHRLHRPALLRAPAFALRAALGPAAGELLASRRVIPRRAQENGFRFGCTALDDALAMEVD
jgi:hypothetical protein